ncbi:MAG: hypothetical protein WBA93_05180 [Microcoleaceae cyanobacterium]
MLDILGEQGLGQRNNFKVYFAPVEAMTQGCHLVEDVTMGKSDYGQLEAELYRYGFEKGLTQLPYPPRFHGTCAAVKPKGLVIIPSGNIHTAKVKKSSIDRIGSFPIRFSTALVMLSPIKIVRSLVGSDRATH